MSTVSRQWHLESWNITNEGEVPYKCALRVTYLSRICHTGKWPHLIECVFLPLLTNIVFFWLTEKADLCEKAYDLGKCLMKEVRVSYWVGALPFRLSYIQKYLRISMGPFWFSQIILQFCVSFRRMLQCFRVGWNFVPLEWTCLMKYFESFVGFIVNI